MTDDRNPFGQSATDLDPSKNPFGRPENAGPVAKNSAFKTIGDLALDVVKGGLDVGKQAYGLGNVATGGMLDPASRKIGALASQAITAGMNALTGQNVEATDAAHAPSIAEGFHTVSDHLSGAQSDYRRKLEQERSRAIRDADGALAETGAAVSQTLGNPSLLVGDVVRSAPSMLVPAAAGRKIAGMMGPQLAEQAAARALAGGAGREAAQLAGQEAVNKLATRAVIGVTGIGQVGGGADIDAIGNFAEVPTATLEQNPQYQLLRGQGMGEQEARDELARKAGLTAFAVAAPLSMVASKVTGAGEQLARVATGQYAGKTIRDLAMSMGKEAAQEYPESFGEQFGQGLGMQQYGDITTDPTKGAYGAGAMGALAGGVMGAGEHVAGWALHRGQPQSEAASGGNAPTQEQRPPDNVPPAGPSVAPSAPSSLAPDQGPPPAAPDAVLAPPPLPPDAGPLTRAASLATAAQQGGTSLFPFSDLAGAQKQADDLTMQHGIPYAAGEHPTVVGRFAAQPVALKGDDDTFLKAAERQGFDPLTAKLLASGDTAEGLFNDVRAYYPEVPPHEWRNDQARANMTATFLMHEQEALTALLGAEPTAIESYIARQIGTKPAADMITMSEAERSIPVSEVIPNAATEQRLGLSGMSVDEALQTLTSQALAKLDAINGGDNGNLGTAVPAADARATGQHDQQPVADAGRSGTVGAGPVTAETGVAGGSQNPTGTSVGGPERAGAVVDELYQQAVKHVIDNNTASSKGLSLALQLGYTRTQRLLERMEADGLVSRMEPNGARTVLPGAAERAQQLAAPAATDQPSDAAQVAIEAAKIARREHPASADPRTAPILARETFLQDLARKNPEQAQQIAAEMRADPQRFSELAGVSPEKIGAYAGVIEGQLKLAPPANRTPDRAAIDAAAHAAATSPLNDLPEPSARQIAAGTYQKGHLRLHGLDISIENPVGSTRSGTDQSGKAWQTTMEDHYGYIKGTRGADKDHIDTFIGPNPASAKVFVVDQTNPTTGKFDEHKVMLGYDNLDAAKAGYAAHYAKDWQGGQQVAETTVDGLKQWFKTGDTTKAFAPPQSATAPAPVRASGPVNYPNRALGFQQAKTDPQDEYNDHVWANVAAANMKVGDAFTLNGKQQTVQSISGKTLKLQDADGKVRTYSPDGVAWGQLQRDLGGQLTQENLRGASTLKPPLPTPLLDIFKRDPAVHIDANHSHYLRDGGPINEPAPAKQDQDRDLDAQTGHSSQFESYAKWIADGKPVPEGMVEQIKGDERLRDGEGDALLTALAQREAAPDNAKQTSAPLPNATAPEHVQQGVDDRELAQIVKEFNQAQEGLMTGDDEDGEGGQDVTNIFMPPKKDEVVRLNDKVKVYHKEHGWMTPEQAKAKIAEWKAHAQAQGKNAASRSANSQRVVLSLFDLSGEWSKPWEEAGYQVYRFDIQDDPEMGDVNNFSTEFFSDWFGDFDGQDVYAILAATPCTDFAVSGARHFAAKDKDGRTVASVKLVHQTLATIEYFKPSVWAVENPVGRIEQLGGLPPWRLSFDPNHVGDPYTKKTLIWGRFNGDLPIAPVEPTEGSKMFRLYGGKSQATKNARSVTPEGFSYAFFMANNAIDHPAMAMANKYDRLDRDLIEQAIKAGVTEDQIDSAVEDFYYQDLDDDAANDALRELIDEAGTQQEQKGKDADAAAPSVEQQLAELLAGLPEGASFVRGKGRIADHYAVSLNGDTVGSYEATPQAAVASAKVQLAKKAEFARQAERQKTLEQAIAAKVRDGALLTDADLKTLDLHNPAEFSYLSPVVQRLFGISSRKVREAMGDALKLGHTDMGAEKWSGNPRKALANAAAWAAAQEAKTDALAPAAPAVEAPALGKQVSRYTGHYGKGMNQLNAKQYAAQETKTHPEFDYTVEAAEEEFGDGKYVVVVREKTAAPPATTPAPAKPAIAREGDDELIAQAKAWGYTDDTLPKGGVGGGLPLSIPGAKEAYAFDNQRTGKEQLSYTINTVQGPNGQWGGVAKWAMGGGTQDSAKGGSSFIAWDAQQYPSQQAAVQAAFDRMKDAVSADLYSGKLHNSFKQYLARQAYEAKRAELPDAKLRFAKGFATPEQELARVPLLVAVHQAEGSVAKDRQKWLNKAVTALAKLPQGRLTVDGGMALKEHLDKNGKFIPSVYSQNLLSTGYIAPFIKEHTAADIDAVYQQYVDFTKGKPLLTRDYFLRTLQEQDAASKAAAKAAPDVAAKRARGAEREVYGVLSKLPGLADAVALDKADFTKTVQALVNDWLDAQSTDAAGDSERQAVLATLRQGGELTLPQEFYDSLHQYARRTARQAAKEAARDPAVYKQALLDATIAAGLPVDADQVAVFMAGWDHALAGKTRSTLPENALMGQGYDAARVWIKTDEGRAFYEGKPQKKLENTGMDLRRWFDERRAKIKDVTPDDMPASYEIIKAQTSRAEVFADLAGSNATPGTLRYIAAVRDQLLPFQEWLLSNTGPLHDNNMYGEYLRASAPESAHIAAFLDGRTYRSVPAWHRDIDPYPAVGEGAPATARLALLQTAANFYVGELRKVAGALQGATSVLQASQGFAKLMRETKDGKENYSEDGKVLHDLFRKGRDYYYLPGGWRMSDLARTETAPDDPTQRKQALITPRLDSVVREGLPDHRKGKDVTPQQMKSTFGFADVGFGKWVSSKQDQDHLNYAYDAFMDLAQFLKQDPKIIGLGGKLHFTIGALGHGKHAAHFQYAHTAPDGTQVPVINLTNTRGDGTVAHEWFHALDWALNQGYETITGKDDKAYQTWLPHNAVAKVISLLSRSYHATGLDRDVMPFLRGEMHMRSLGKPKTTQDLIEHARAAVDYYVSRKAMPTQYKSNADALGADYWGNRRELFARAAESWVLDNLDGVHNYLVNPAWAGEGAIAPPTYKGTPYPTGEERTTFAGAFGALAKALRFDPATGVSVDMDAFTKEFGNPVADFRSEVAALKERIPAMLEQYRADERAAATARSERAAAAAAEKEAALKAAYDLAMAQELEKQPPKVATTTGLPTDDELLALLDDAEASLAEEQQEQPDAPAPGEVAAGPRAWTQEDYRFLLNQIEQKKYVVLLADPVAGLPTIHDVPNAVHVGYGVLKKSTPDYEVSFDGGGAMRQTPSGQAWTPVLITRGREAFLQAIGYDQAIAKLKAKVLVKAGPKAAPTLDTVQQKAAGELVKEAAKLGVTGVKEAFEGLYAIFGGGSGRKMSFPSGFDQEAYAKAKPHFQAALQAFQQAGKSLKDLFKLLIQTFGPGVKPYLFQFAKEQKLTLDLRPVGSAIEETTAMDNTVAKEQENHDSTPATGSPALDSALAGGPATGAVPPTDAIRGAGDLDQGQGPGDDGRVRRAGFGPDVPAAKTAGVGDGTGDTGVSNPAPDALERNHQRQAAGHDYRPSVDDLARTGSWLDTATRNVDLIELARRIEAEQRAATPEEQAQLAKYVGFGAGEVRNKLFPVPSIYQREDDPQRLIWPDLINEKPWKALAERLDQLPRDWQRSILQSTQYAHYTSAPVIRAIWQGVQRLGFTGGKVLEPGMGIGSFNMLMPDAVHATSQYTGIEFDAPTALIARLLSPQQNMLHADFIKRRVPGNFFDLAIGNPPFAATKIVGDPQYAKQGFALHDYFFAKSMDSVRPGGLLVFVTSRYTMDKASDKARKFLADRADLVGAVRLPQTAFRANAGTDVTTDVLFLRKRLPGEAPAGVAWNKQGELATKDGKVLVNQYFAEHPDMILGQPRLAGNTDDMGRRINGLRPGELTVVSYDSTPEELEAKFAAAMERLPQNVYSLTQATAETAKREVGKVDFDPTIKREGVLYLAKNGALMRVSEGVGKPLASLMGKLTPKDEAWLKDYVKLRDLVRVAQAAQFNDGPWEPALKALNKAYDKFVQTHGPVTDFRLQSRTRVGEDGEEITTQTPIFKNRRLYGEDYDAAIVTSLEKTTEDGQIKKAPFLLGRTIGKPVQREVKTVGDALAVSLDTMGKLDLPDVAQRIGLSVEDAIDALGDQIYRLPQGDYQLADEYLSGDVVAKLEEAREAARLDPAMEKNIAALVAVQPARLGPSQIAVKLGASWVPPRYVNRFASHINAGAVTFDPQTESWQVEGGNQRTGRSASEEFGTANRSPSELLEAVLNSRPIVIKHDKSAGEDLAGKTNTDATTAANEMARKIRQEFSTWVWQDSERAADLVDIYNRIANNIAPRRFDGSHLTLPGVSLRYQLYPHQLRAIWRVVSSGSTYLAHAVGAGKTIEMVAAGMEQKRLGLVKKPMYVVPNHMLEQFSNEFMELYPLANIMVADDKNFSAERRRAFVAAATLNAPDAVIITHSAFKLLSVKEESVTPIREEILWELESALEEAKKDSGQRVRRAQLEQQVEAVNQRFDKILGGARKDSSIKFEDIGVDQVIVDEAHAFRKLDFETAQRIKGIDPNGSQAALDMYVKTRHLERINPGRGVVFASGTPVTNTMGELYTVMRYFAPDMLDRLGIASFDAWSRMFGDVVAALEPNATGKYEMVERFAKFSNIPELMSRVRSFMDVLTSEHLGALVKRPDVEGGKPNMVVVPQSQALKDYMANVLTPRLERSKRWKPSKEQPFNPDPVIAIISDGKFAALDPRFFGAKLDAKTPTKITALAERIVTEYKATKHEQFSDPDTGKTDVIRGGAQIVFYNLGFGASAKANRGFDARADLTKRLVEGGIKRSEIGWFDDAATDAQKEDIFKRMRNGQLRVLIGSAKKMGTGVNVQKRLSALHYFDPPWFPSDVEQPHGRILRQGNQHGAVRLFWYSTKGTYDETMWQMVARKQRFIDQAFAGDPSLRSMEDVSQASLFEEAAAVSSGDPRVIQLAGLRQDVERLERLQSAHYNEQVNLKEEQRRHGWYLESATKNVAKLDAAFKVLGEQHVNFTSGKVGDIRYDNATDFGVALIKAFNEHREFEIATHQAGGTPLATLDNGVVLHATTVMDRHGPSDTVTLSARIGDMDRPVVNSTGPMDEGVSPVGLTRSVMNTLNSVASDMTKQRMLAKEATETLARINKKLGAPFAQAQEMVEKHAEMLALEEQLRAEGQAAAQASLTVNEQGEVGAAPAAAQAVPVAPTQTLAFQQWFGQSKVVDEQGNPLVVYHGTTPWEKEDGRQLGNIEVFDRLASVNIVRRKASIDTVGSWFSTSPGEKGAGMYGSTIYPVYLSIQNPHQTTFDRLLRRARMLANGVDDGRMVGEAEVNALRKWLQDTGKDGIRVVHNTDSESTEFAQQDAWIALEPQQIKSAIGNAGTFNPASPLLVEQGQPPYDGHADEPGYTDPYVHTETRPGTRGAQLDAGRSAVADLARRIGAARYLHGAVPAGETGKVLGQSLLDNFVAGKPNQLIGLTVKSPVDLATLAQVYRDPRFETFRVVFTQGGKVVGESGYTSRLPGGVRLPNNLGQQIATDKARFGADQYYILHNHPSGSAEPTLADIETTQKIANLVPGLQQHVVIDHNEYAVIDPHSGKVDVTRDWTLNGVDYRGHPAVPHALLGMELAQASDVAALGKALQVPDGHATLVMTSQNKVSLLVDVPMAGLMDMSPAGIVKGRALMRALSREAGAADLRFIVLPDGADASALQRWLSAGVVTDVVTAGGLSLDTLTRAGGHTDFDAPGKAMRVYQQSPQYNAPKPFNGTPAEMAKKVGTVLQHNTVGYAKNKGVDLRGILLQMLGRRQLMDVYGSLFPQEGGRPNSVQAYNALAMRMDAEKNDAGAKADDIAVRWGKLKDHKALAELMHDATLAQIDPRKPMPGWVTLPREYEALKRRFAALTPEAQAIFNEAAAAYEQHYADVKQAVRNRIIRALPDHPRRAELLRKMDSEMFNDIQGIYFPLARFGDYIVQVKGPDGVVESVSFAETMNEAQAVREEMLKTYALRPDYEVLQIVRRKEFNAARDSVGRGFLQQLYGVLEATGADPEASSELQDAISQLYLTSLPDLSWAKHGIHRKGTPGFSQDARRAFAHNMFHGARYLAKLHYVDRLSERLDEMQDYVNAHAQDKGYDAVKAQQVVDEMVKRHDLYINPNTHPLATALTSAGFMYFLGLSPASAVTNLTQTALVAYPVLGGRYGFGKAGAALLRASKDAMSGHNNMAKVLSGEELAAYNEWVRIGLIDVSMAHDLAGIASGDDNKIAGKLAPAMKAAAFLFHHAERFNRQATALAAYRLARGQGMTHHQALEAAVEDTYAGHFDYSAGNRPRIMQGNVARVALLFKQYGQNMVYSFSRNTQLALRGDRQALKTLTGLLVTHALAAGVLGLPLVTTLLGMASLIGGSDDDPWDAKIALRNLFADLFGDEAGEALAHGLSRLTPWDISSRVGLNNLLLPDVQEGLEGARFAESALVGVAGPMAGLVVNLAKGGHDLLQNNYQRGLEEMAPSALRGVLRAYRYASEGVQDRTGIELVPETTLAEDAGQLLGFSPSRAREAQEGKSAVYRTDKTLQARRQELMNKYAQAVMHHEDTEDVLAAIQHYNELHPQRRIAALHLQQSIRARLQRVEQAQQGIFLPKSRQDARAAGAFANPNE